jgi:hypothetical protein
VGEISGHRLGFLPSNKVGDGPFFENGQESSFGHHDQFVQSAELMFTTVVLAVAGLQQVIGSLD